MQAFEPAFIQPPGPDRKKKVHSTFTATSPPVDGLFSRQTYESYSPGDHATWRLLNDRMKEYWNLYASERFLKGLERLQLPANELPRLERVDAAVFPHSGFCTTAVKGRLPQFLFFDCLRNRELPTAVAIRGADSPDFLPAPDIFHDVAAEVPMVSDRAFAEALVAFGDCVNSAAEIAGLMHDPAERSGRLASILKAIGRLYAFTVEFGLMRHGDRLRAYGARLLSSAGELARAVDSPKVQRCELNLSWVIHQPFAIGNYQPLLFFVESLDQLAELTRTLERWIWEGRLDHVASGEPEPSSADLDSFLLACGSH